MSKSPDAFRTISEVAEWLGVQAHVLRFWESKFNQVKPVKRAGGRRYYRPTDMQLLGGIKKLLHDDGLTIKGVQKILREQGVSHVQSVSQSLDQSASAEVADGGTVVKFQNRSTTSSAAEQIDMSLDDQPSMDQPDEQEPDPSVGLPTFRHTPSIADPREPDAEEAPIVEFVAAKPDVDEPETTDEPVPSPDTASAPQPLLVDRPDPPTDDEIEAEPGLLTQLARLQSLPLEHAPEVAAAVADLRKLVDRLDTESAA